MDREREELFELWSRYGSSFESDSSEGYELADAILAAGYRKVKCADIAADIRALVKGDGK